MTLQHYDFDIKHRSGKLNSNADYYYYLSRMPVNNIQINLLNLPTDFMNININILLINNLQETSGLKHLYEAQRRTPTIALQIRAFKAMITDSTPNPSPSLKMEYLCIYEVQIISRKDNLLDINM